MARRQHPSAYDGGDSPYGQAGGSPYGRADGSARGRSGAYDPGAYGQPGTYATGAHDASPYANPYATGARDAGAYAGTRSPAGHDRRAGRQPAAAYPVGTGRTFESSRGTAGGGAVGVNPATSWGYRQANPYGGASGGKGPRKPPSRRTFVAAAGGVLAAVALGAVGVNWFAHRAVACTVNGAAQQAPLGSTADELVARGLASPSAGNLVSICAEGEIPEVLVAGGGNPYTLTVNGAAVDPATFRLAEGDDVVFSNGTDRTEETVCQNTEIACGVQFPPDGQFLVKIGYVSQWGRNGIASVETGTVSGRSIDRGVVQEPQDLVISIAEHITPSDGRRLIALTFDDGPDLTYTPQYLDILARYGARATFFNLGKSIDEGPEYAALARRCAEEGHQVASHTYAHKNLLELDAAGVAAEIDRGFGAVSDATGVPTNVMRPPYGNLYGSTFYNYLLQGGDIAYSAYWGVDSLDWDVAGRTSVGDGASQIIAGCTVGLDAESYNGAIVLMHDGGGNRDRDVAALPGLIEAYQAYGYELVTLNELLAADPAFPAWVTGGLAARPEGAVVPAIW